MLKNIIFDFGGVLLNIDYQKTVDAFISLGYPQFSQMFSQHYANDLFQKLETGHITPDAFYKELKNFAPTPVTTAQLQHAWNAMLISYRIESLNFLNRLKNQYQLFLLSNTNEIHYQAFSQMLCQQTPYKKLEDFFNKAWYSHQIHLRKPDIQTFEYILADANLQPAETIFIDDTDTNLPTAQQLGINTHLLLSNERIETIDYTHIIQ